MYTGQISTRYVYILAQINEASGTKSKVLEDGAAESMHRRGFTSVPTSQPPKSKSKNIPMSSGGAEVNHGEDVTEAILEVRSDHSPITWACIGYEGNDVKKPLTVSRQRPSTPFTIKCVRLYIIWFYTFVV